MPGTFYEDYAILRVNVTAWEIPPPFTEIIGQILANPPGFLRYAYIH